MSGCADLASEGGGDGVRAQLPQRQGSRADQHVHRGVGAERARDLRQGKGQAGLHERPAHSFSPPPPALLMLVLVLVLLLVAGVGGQAMCGPPCGPVFRPYLPLVTGYRSHFCSCT